MKDVYAVEMINAAAWFLPQKTFEIVGGFDPIFFYTARMTISANGYYIII